jgi:hypothetical protein
MDFSQLTLGLFVIFFKITFNFMVFIEDFYYITINCHFIILYIIKNKYLYKNITYQMILINQNFN